jgi:hypothetical protein
MNHHFFKFGIKNCFFEKCLGEKKSIIPLSIYFGDWKIEQYQKHIETEKSQNKTQIETFFKCAEENTTSFFWIFYKNHVYVLKPDGEIQNGDPSFTDWSGAPPKTIPCKIMKEFLGDKLPEMFATLNSNQKYNRKTIVKFDSKIEKICNYLLEESNMPSNKMKIKHSERLEYLSPIQFETLVFLIFHHNDSYVSTYRGGTLEGFDLKVFLSKKNRIDGIENVGTVYIQVKMKEHKNFSHSENKYLIHLGKDCSKKHILGKKWIEVELSKLEKVEDWLEQSLDFFEIIKD